MRRRLGLALLCALAGYGSALAVHPDVTLKDRFGNPVSQSKLPVDVRKSCGSCHDVDFIGVAYHFQQGRLVILSEEIYRQNYFSRYGTTEFTNGLPEELTALD